jgi:hypothetical protein
MTTVLQILSVAQSGSLASTPLPWPTLRRKRRRRLLALAAA